MSVVDIGHAVAWLIVLTKDTLRSIRFQGQVGFLDKILHEA